MFKAAKNLSLDVMLRDAHIGQWKVAPLVRTVTLRWWRALVTLGIGRGAHSFWELANLGNSGLEHVSPAIRITAI